SRAQGERQVRVSRLIDASGAANSPYQLKVVQLDEVVAFSDRKLATKIDVENYECKVLGGMQRILRENECMIQVESFETLDRVTSLLTAAGYDLVARFPPNFVFENIKTRQSKP